jgi:hypothetical protein
MIPALWRDKASSTAAGLPFLHDTHHVESRFFFHSGSLLYRNDPFVAVLSPAI